MDKKYEKVLNDLNNKDWSERDRLAEAVLSLSNTFFNLDDPDSMQIHNALNRIFDLLGWYNAKDDSPEEEDDYLVTYLDDIGRKHMDIMEYAFNEWQTEDFGKNIKVLAWMPLPEMFEE